MTIEQARQFRAKLTIIISDFDDASAFDIVELYPAWKNDSNYQIGDRRRYDGQLYRCLQPHPAQADWTPDVAVSLWVRIDDPAIEWPEWVQPESTNPYNTGDKVTFEGKRYISKINANTWSPLAYPAGWEVQA